MPTQPQQIDSIISLPIFMVICILIGAATFGSLRINHDPQPRFGEPPQQFEHLEKVAMDAEEIEDENLTPRIER